MGLVFFLQAFTLNFLTDVFAVFNQEDDDDRICTPLRKFGQYGDDNTDLDKIQCSLALQERTITETLFKMDKDNKKNNIVLAKLTVIVRGEDNKNNGLTVMIPMPNTELPQVFESTVNRRAQHKENSEENLKDYSFKGDLSSIPVVISHINKIWGKKEEVNSRVRWKKKPDFLYREDLIWEDFYDLQTQLWEQKEGLKKLVTQIALTNFTQKFSELALALTETGAIEDQTEILRNNVASNKEATPSKLLDKMIKLIESKKKGIEAEEKKFKTAVTLVYHYFWHSEQRLIHFLESPQSASFWEELVDKIGENQVVGAFLHLHSRYNLCRTCRCAVARSSRKEGAVYEKFLEKLERSDISKTNDFFFKVLASFRVHYDCQYKKQIVWMPYNPSGFNSGVGSLKFNDSPPLYIKKIRLGEQEEKEQDKEYIEAWKKYLEDTKLTEKNQDYLNDFYSYLELRLEELEYRIESLEQTLEGVLNN